MSKLKTRNFEYQGKQGKKSFFANKKLRNLFLGIGSALLLVLIILTCIEPLVKNKLVIHNKSSHRISSLQFWYEDDNGIISEVLSFEDIAAKEKISNSSEKLGLAGLYGAAWLTVKIAFEDGGEALLQTGQYLNDFEGKISFEIRDTRSEELELHLQAGEGLFNSTAVTECDDIYYINPKSGYIE